jgi:hypothetical protein
LGAVSERPWLIARHGRTTEQEIKAHLMAHAGSMLKHSCGSVNRLLDATVKDSFLARGPLELATFPTGSRTASTVL